MQFNPYSRVGNLPRNNIASLMSGASTSMNRMGQNLLSGVDALRSVGMANENELYNTKLTALQNSPEFLNANPMQRQAMVQSAGSGLELDEQNLTGKEQLFKSLGQEQENLNQVDRAKTADENALARLGIQINADESQAQDVRTFKSDESEKGRTFDSAQAEKLADATAKQNAIRNKQVFQLIKDEEGNYYKTTVGGDVGSLGVKGLIPKTGSGPIDKRSPIEKLGLSKDAEIGMMNMSKKQQSSLLTDEGTMKPNIAWVAVPERRNNKGQIIQSKGGYFEDRNNGQRIVASSRDEEVPKPQPTTMEKIYSLFN